MDGASVLRVLYALLLFTKLKQLQFLLPLVF